MDSGAIVHKDIHNEKRWAVDPRREEIEKEAEESYKKVRDNFDQVPENIENLMVHMKKQRRARA